MSVISAQYMPSNSSTAESVPAQSLCSHFNLGSTRQPQNSHLRYFADITPEKALAYSTGNTYLYGAGMRNFLDSIAQQIYLYLAFTLVHE